MKKIVKILVATLALTVMSAVPAEAAILIGPPLELQGSVVQIQPYMIHTQTPSMIPRVPTVPPITGGSVTSSPEAQGSSVVSLRGLIPPASVVLPGSVSANPDDVGFYNPPANETAVMPQVPAATTLTASEQEMVDDINQERTAAGVAPLRVDLRLVTAARTKAEDMDLNHYFSHVSPNFGYTGSLLPGVGYWSENIAGNDSVEGAMAAFMFSLGHRLNILDPNVNAVGVGILEGITPYNLYVQEFVHE